MLKQKFKNSHTVYFLGLLLTVVFLLFCLISYQFSATEPDAQQLPVIEFVSLLIIAGVLYLFSINYRFNEGNARRMLFFIFACGFVFRVISIFSLPILEDDYYRYLWDGAVTSHFANPYKHSPLQYSEGSVKLPVPEDKSFISNITLNNINHPQLRTIYPPVAQVFFAFSSYIAPFDLYFFKALLLLFDLITFFILIAVLRRLNMPELNIIIYWWNPILVTTVFISAHFEVIAFPFVLAAIYFGYLKKVYSSVFSLVVGVGIKLWPAFIVSIVLRMASEKLRDMVKPALIFVVLILAMFTPVLIAGLDHSSGFLAYGKSWENNSSAFRIFLFFIEKILLARDIHPGHAENYTRLFIILVLSLWVVYQTIIFERSEGDMYKRCLFIVAAVFLLIPTQFPWYYLWLLPFLTVVPRFSLIFLTLTLSLYYLRFYLEPLGLLYIFNDYVAWIEFLPVWILLVLEMGKEKLLRNF